MTSKYLKTWQFAQLRASIAPKLGYFARLQDRVAKLGIGPTDPLLVASRDAHDAVFSLFVLLHQLAEKARKRERDAKPGGA